VFNNKVLSLLCVLVGWFLCIIAADQYPLLSVIGLVVFAIWFFAIREHWEIERQKEDENENHKKGE